MNQEQHINKVINLVLKALHNGPASKNELCKISYEIQNGYIIYPVRNHIVKRKRISKNDIVTALHKMNTNGQVVFLGGRKWKLTDIGQVQSNALIDINKPLITYLPKLLCRRLNKQGWRVYNGIVQILITAPNIFELSELVIATKTVNNIHYEYFATGHIQFHEY